MYREIVLSKRENQNDSITLKAEREIKIEKSANSRKKEGIKMLLHGKSEGVGKKKS